MRNAVARRAGKLAGREAFVLAVVVRREPPSSARVGDAAIITADGAFDGWVGGSCTRPTVVREALAALADGRPRLIALAPDPTTVMRPGITALPMTCHSGGSVEILIEPVLPGPRLVVFGTSAPALALVRLGKAAGYTIDLIDPEQTAVDVPDADRVLTEPGAPIAGVPAYAVVATGGERDEEAIQQAFRLAPAYLGLVSSRRRFQDVARNLRAMGLTEAQIAGITTPAGLDLGAEAPEEIALSILAQLVTVRRTAAPQQPATATPAPAAEAAEAIDPICGMTVPIAGAKHTAEVDGVTYYFCCGGCRTRFLADPAQYIDAEKPA